MRQYACGELRRQYLNFVGGTAAAAPPPFRLGDPPLCGSHPL